MYNQFILWFVYEVVMRLKVLCIHISMELKSINAILILNNSKIEVAHKTYQLFEQFDFFL